VTEEELDRRIERAATIDAAVKAFSAPDDISSPLTEGIDIAGNATEYIVAAKTALRSASPSTGPAESANDRWCEVAQISAILAVAAQMSELTSVMREIRDEMKKVDKKESVEGEMQEVADRKRRMIRGHATR
jgi:hypothetical protein